MPNKEHEMNLQHRQSRRGLHSGDGPELGRKRLVDIDENGIYRPLSIKISERLHRRLGLATAAMGKTKLQFVVECIEPVVDEILDAQGISD